LSFKCNPKRLEYYLEGKRNATEEDDPLTEESLQGRPKTSEAPPEDIPREKLPSEIDFSMDLTED
jgi:hypothetical protein